MPVTRLLLAINAGEAGAQVLRFGRELARALGAEVAIVTVVDPRSGVAVDGGLPVEQVLETLRREARGLLDRASAEFGGDCKVWTQLREGDAGAEICQSARDWTAGFIVLGQEEEAGDEGEVLATVLRSASCPVVVVHRPAVSAVDKSPLPAHEAGQSAQVEDGAGLGQRQAEALLMAHGANEVVPPARSWAISFLAQFWGPVAWILEATLLAELIFLWRWRQAMLIALLLLVNAGVATFYEGRAGAAVAALRKRLTVLARVRRDGAWTMRPAREVVPGDVVRLRPGDVVPADLRLIEGTALLDYSMLTGEALPVEAGARSAAHSGTVVRRGEATGVVTETGTRTVFGKTASLARHAQPSGRMHAIMMRLVRLLAFVAIAISLVVAVAAPLAGVPWQDAAAFGLALLIVIIPVSLPTMVTLTGAVGARELAARGILLTRLSAVQDSAAMDVLCIDKTGTLTSNDISVERVVCARGVSERDVLLAAAGASTAATLDPLDLATLRAAGAAGIDPAAAAQVDFVPFDPGRKRCEGVVRFEGRVIRGVKGAPQAVAALLDRTEVEGSGLMAMVDQLSGTGGRVLAVAVADPADGPLRPAGLILFADPPRPDSAETAARLRALGVRIVMVTGDSLATGTSVASAVGMDTRGRAETTPLAPGSSRLDYDIHAGVQPAYKLALVREFQEAGHVVGMTGDGVNDARALRQADMGIAVAAASDTARGAAGVVLTEAGLSEVVEAVRIGRGIHQRIISYILSMIARKVMVVGFLGAMLVATANFAIRPAQVLLLVLINGFLTMSLAADRVGPLGAPARWNTRWIATVSLTMAGLWTLLLGAIYLAAARWLDLSEGQMHTLAFVLLVLAGHAVVFNVRTRGWFWSARPGVWVVAMTALGVAMTTLAAIAGVLMVPIPAPVMLGLLGSAAAGMAAVDAVKVLALKGWFDGPVQRGADGARAPGQ